MKRTRGKAEPGFPLPHNYCAEIARGQANDGIVVHAGNMNFRNPLQEVAARMKIRPRNEMGVLDYED